MYFIDNGKGMEPSVLENIFSLNVIINQIYNPNLHSPTPSTNNRITESSDTRITENGDTRIVE